MAPGLSIRRSADRHCPRSICPQVDPERRTEPILPVKASPQHSAGDQIRPTICAVNPAKGDPVNREHVYPDAALRPDPFLAEQVLGERRRHRLCASVTASLAPLIWAPLVSPVCGRTFDDPCRAPCSGVT